MAVDKLVDSSQLDLDLTSVANAIRAKSGGSSVLLFPAGFVSEIQNIPSGGGSDVSDYIGNTFTTPITYDGTILKKYSVACKGTAQNPLVFNAPNLVQIGEDATDHYTFCNSVISAINPKQTPTDGHMCIISGKYTFYYTNFVGSVDWSKFEINSLSGRTNNMFELAIFNADQVIPLIFNSTYSLASIGINANVTISELTSINNDYLVRGVYTNGRGKYYLNFPKLASITVSGSNAFAYSSGIKKITQVATSDIPNNLPSSNGVLVNMPLLTVIHGGAAFFSCQNLEEIDMQVITNITGTQAFYGCAKLKSANLPRLTNIPYRTFYSCVALKTVILQDIATIDEQAFYGCAALTDFVLDISSDTSDPLPTLKYTNAFGNTAISRGTGYIYVTDERVEQLKTATNWSSYANQIKPLSERPSA